MASVRTANTPDFTTCYSIRTKELFFEGFQGEGECPCVLWPIHIVFLPITLTIISAILAFMDLNDIKIFNNASNSVRCATSLIKKNSDSHLTKMEKLKRAQDHIKATIKLTDGEIKHTYNVLSCSRIVDIVPLYDAKTSFLLNIEELFHQMDLKFDHQKTVENNLLDLINNLTEKMSTAETNAKSIAENNAFIMEIAANAINNRDINNSDEVFILKAGVAFGTNSPFSDIPNYNVTLFQPSSNPHHVNEQNVAALRA